MFVIDSISELKKYVFCRRIEIFINIDDLLGKVRNQIKARCGKNSELNNNHGRKRWSCQNIKAAGPKGATSQACLFRS